MRKQDLYNFIELKMKSKIQESFKQESEIEAAIISKIDSEVIGLDKLSKEFSKLVDILEESHKKHSEAFDWSLKNEIRNAYDLMKFKKSLVDRIFYGIARKYLREGRDAELSILKSKYPQTYEVIKSTKSEYEKITKDRIQIAMLKSELNNVVKTSKTAKDGYKNLIALGVDMKDFKESPNNLPAVQKLSVDVCLINGNC